MRISASGAGSTRCTRRTNSARPRRARRSGRASQGASPSTLRAHYFADDSAPVLRAAQAHGIRWLYAVRRPVQRAPARAPIEFPGVESVHELGTGLAPLATRAQVAGR
ncbi:MAG: hypothetical protein WDZ66_09685 [Steroidobacteraceae bacterium]